MSEREDPLDQGPIEQDPTAEAGPEDCNASVPDTEFKPGTLEAMPEADSPKFMEELLESFAPLPGVAVTSPEDGLPIPSSELQGDNLATAPPFSRETVICVEDDRQYVEIFLEEAIERGLVEVREVELVDVVGGGIFGDEHRASSQSKWTRSGLGIAPGVYTSTVPVHMVLRSMFAPTGERLERRVVSPDMIVFLFGLPFFAGGDVMNNDSSVISIFPMSVEPVGRWRIPVRPIRERCKNYKRQVLGNDEVPNPTDFGHRIVFRNCEARRSVGGAFLSLRDEAVYACDYRDPPDPDSAKRFLDDPDRYKLDSGAHKIKLPLFKKE